MDARKVRLAAGGLSLAVMVCLGLLCVLLYLHLKVEEGQVAKLTRQYALLAVERELPEMIAAVMDENPALPAASLPWYINPEYNAGARACVDLYRREDLSPGLYPCPSSPRLYLVLTTSLAFAPLDLLCAARRILYDQSIPLGGVSLSLAHDPHDAGMQTGAGHCTRYSILVDDFNRQRLHLEACSEGPHTLHETGPLSGVMLLTAGLLTLALAVLHRKRREEEAREAAREAEQRLRASTENIEQLPSMDPNQIQKDMEQEYRRKLTAQAENLSYILNTIRHILDSIPPGLVVVNARLQIIMVNKNFYRIAAPTHSSLTLVALPEVLPPDLVEIIRRHAESRTPLKDHEISLAEQKAPDAQRPRILSLNIIPLTGKTLKTLVLLQDITEHRTLQAELRQSDRLASVGTLISGVGHEINNPLNAVVGLVEVLKDMDGLKDEHRRYIEMIGTHGQRIADIVRELSAYNHSARVSEPVASEPRRLVENTLNMVGQAYRFMGNVAMYTSLEDQLPLVKVIPGDVSQLFLHLVRNALETMEEKRSTGPDDYIPTLHVSAQMEGEGDDRQLVVSIEDNGMGMDAATLDRMYDPFFTTRAKSTGLGLSISRRIAQDAGVRLIITSERHQGTVARVCFPHTLFVSAGG